MSDLEGRCFIRRGQTLVPADFAADEFLSGVKEGQEIIVSTRKPRNPKHHRWFFALLRKVKEATDLWSDEDRLLDAIKMDIGHVTPVRKMTGEIVMVPASINFAALDETQFREFSDKSVALLSNLVDVDSLMQEVNKTQRGKENV